MAGGPTLLVVVGVQRSGLSLLRAMLDSHPNLAVAPESTLTTLATCVPDGPFDPQRFVSTLYADPAVTRWAPDRRAVERSWSDGYPADDAAAARGVLSLWASSLGKKRYGTMASLQTAQLGPLAARLPDVRIVHLIRDGRDIAASVLELGRAESIVPVALDWRRQVRQARRAGRRLPRNRYSELRYEDLVSEPDITLRLLCQTLDLPFDAAMLDYRASATRATKATGKGHENRYVTRPLMPHVRQWRRDLPRTAVARFEALAGDLLTELGYERQSRRPSTAALLATRGPWLQSLIRGKRTRPPGGGSMTSSSS